MNLKIENIIKKINSIDFNNIIYKIIKDKRYVKEIIGYDIYSINTELGVDFLTDENDNVNVIFLYGYSQDEHKMFQETLPFGLDFEFCRNDVLNKLGVPYKTTEPIKILKVNKRDNFNFGDCKILIEYTEDLNKISLIQISF